MCIAIVKTKDGKLTDNQLKNCFDSNPDGAGIAYSHDGTLWIVKGIFTEKEFIEQYHKAEELADGAMLIHCRISTSGKIDRTNCHPHVVHDNCVMIHNGVLNAVVDVPKGSEVSDTVIYVEKLLRPLPRDFMLDKGIISFITHHIGTGNKFCFLNSNGEYAIANEKAGHWKNGVWFSNHSYEDWGYYYGKSGKSWKKTKYGYTSTGKKSNCYTDDYEYDYGYGYGYEDDEYYSLTNDEKEKLEVVFNNLTAEQFVKLGLNPTYDFWTGSLVRTTDATQRCTSKKTLAELDEYLDEIYEELYYEAIDDVLKKYDDDYETAVSNHDLEPYESFILKQYLLGTTSEEDVNWELDNEFYTLKLTDVEIDDDDEDIEFFDDDDDDTDNKDVVATYDNKGNLIDDKEIYSDDSYERHEPKHLIKINNTK